MTSGTLGSRTHCKDCGIELTEFNIVRVLTQNTIRSRCRICYNNYIYEYKKGNENQKFVNKKASLKYLYNITQEKYDELSEIQNYLCAICRQESRIKGRELSVDHDHKTNAIRGLLCHKCNVAIGLLDENIEILQSAIDYLIKFQADRKIS
jgi:hypothetical protein